MTRTNLHKWRLEDLGCLERHYLDSIGIKGDTLGGTPHQVFARRRLAGVAASKTRLSRLPIANLRACECGPSRVRMFKVEVQAAITESLAARVALKYMKIAQGSSAIGAGIRT